MKGTLPTMFPEWVINSDELHCLWLWHSFIHSFIFFVEHFSEGGNLISSPIQKERVVPSDPKLATVPDVETNQMDDSVKQQKDQQNDAWVLHALI